MNNSLKLFLVATLFVASSCSFANKSTVTVPISSNPPGATVVIDGENYGQTPAFIDLKPSKNYKATISKIGYESKTIDMKTWYSVREGNGGDGKRCLGDTVFVLPIMVVLLFAPEKCGSFKQSDYHADLQPKKITTPDNSAVNRNPYEQYQEQGNNYQKNNSYNNQLPYHDNLNQVNEYQNSYYKQYQKNPEPYAQPNQASQIDQNNPYQNQAIEENPYQNQTGKQRNW